MSAPVNDGGPAFPESGLSGLPNGEFIHGRPGMMLRDYFAAAALTGLMSNQRLSDSADNAAVAVVAFGLADAMLEARK